PALGGGFLGVETATLEGAGGAWARIGTDTTSAGGGGHTRASGLGRRSRSEAATLALPPATRKPPQQVALQPPMGNVAASEKRTNVPAQLREEAAIQARGGQPRINVKYTFRLHSHGALVDSDEDYEFSLQSVTVGSEPNNYTRQIRKEKAHQLDGWHEITTTE